jgi:serine/threonine-protein kinase
MEEFRKQMLTNGSFPGANRVWRLAGDVVITPVESLPEKIRKEIVSTKGRSEKVGGYYGIERKKVRAFPKIVNRDVVDVMQVFGTSGSTYQDVLAHFVKTRRLNRAELDPHLQKVVKTLIHDNFLIEWDDQDVVSSDLVEPSFHNGDRWLNYTIEENIYCMVDSEIYKVMTDRTPQLRALKIMQKSFPNKLMREKTIRRLKKEFSVISSIQHKNVVKLWDHGVYQGRVYGILDWVEGPNIREYVYSASRPRTDNELLSFSVQCVEAVRAVHLAGFLHGDVHGGNFLVRDGNICLIDFGLSRPVEMRESERENYTEGGVLFYLPPECIERIFDKEKGLWGSIAGEMYSCGVVLYSLFTNRYPYRRKILKKDYMKSILHETPRSFVECKRRPWPEVETVLQKALAKDPKARFASMDEFLRALKSIKRPSP